MQIDDLFHSQSSQIKAFAEMQLHLYRHDISLQDYFLPLQAGAFAGCRVTGEQRGFNRLVTWAIQGADQVSQLRRRQRIKADVLFCPIPYFARKTENQFLIRTLLGLAQTDATILCLLPADAPCRDELEAQLTLIPRFSAFELLVPSSGIYEGPSSSNSIAADAPVAPAALFLNVMTPPVPPGL